MSVIWIELFLYSIYIYIYNQTHLQSIHVHDVIGDVERKKERKKERKTPEAIEK